MSHARSSTSKLPVPRGWAQRRVLPLGLTAAAGWLDSLAWLYLGKVFLSFMSGNLLFLGIASGAAHRDLLIRAAAALAAFMAGSLLGARLTGSRLEPDAAGRAMARPLWLEAALLAVFAGVWIAAGDPAGVSMALIVLGGLAMGLQAAVALAWHVPNVVTVAMTGTLAQLAAIAGWLRREGHSPGISAAPPVSLLVGLILTYLVAAVLVASMPATAALALGPAALVVTALLVEAF